MLVVSSETFGCDLPFLVSRNWCCDLKSMLQPQSLCLYFISMSRPRLDVVTSFLLSSFLPIGHNFSFMLRHPLVALSFQAGRDLKLLVCLFSYHDVEFKSRPSIFFNHCNSYRDLKSMSRPSLLPIHSQPHFLVSTVPFNFSISGRDLTVLLCFGIYVVTSI